MLFFMEQLALKYNNLIACLQVCLDKQENIDV